MSGASVNRVVIAIAIGVIVLGAVVGIVIVLLDPGEQPPVPDNSSPGAVARWCEDLEEAFAPVGPFTSFADAAEAAIAGRLHRPDDEPPLRDRDGYQAWQDEHAEYVASSYLRLLESTPQPMVFTAAAVSVALADAHEGAPVAHPRRAREAARSLDRYRREHCR